MVSTHILPRREPADNGCDFMLLTSKKCPVSNTEVDATAMCAVVKSGVDRKETASVLGGFQEEGKTSSRRIGEGSILGLR